MEEPLTKTVVDFTDTEIAFSNKSDKELKKTARLFKLMSNQILVRIGSTLGLWANSMRLPFLDSFVESTIFDQFCGGKTLKESQPAIDKLNKYKILSVLDYGAEGKSTEEDLDRTLEQLLEGVRFAATTDGVPVVSTKLTALASDEILTKWQSGEGLSADEKIEFQHVVDRVDGLCREAHKLDVAVFVDAEETWMQDTIDYLVEMMMKRYNLKKVVVYTTFQLYRHDALDKLKKSYRKAQSEGYMLGAKLVRGAYMDKERERAQKMGYDSPIQPDKDATDRDYNEAIKFCVEHYETLASCNASHNLESNLLQANLIEEKNILKNHPHLNFCQLYGMSDHITFNLAAAGFNVAKYVVYGPIKEVLPYLVRRAQENTSVTGDMSRELSLIMKEVKRRGL
jgi:proline dehydrogenase